MHLPIKSDSPQRACFEASSFWIKPIIDRIGQRSNRESLFAEIEQQCSRGKAFLFTHNNSFAVLRPMPEKIVQIWVAYSPSGHATEQYLPAIKDLCRQIGAEQIEFETAIDSMERLMPRHGWEKAFTTWRQPINEI